jgi:hypothetical protein
VVFYFIQSQKMEGEASMSNGAEPSGKTEDQNQGGDGTVRMQFDFSKESHKELLRLQQEGGYETPAALIRAALQLYSAAREILPGPKAADKDK